MLKEFCPLVNSWVSENEQLNGLVGGLIIFSYFAITKI